jgi:hypothetical protein
VIPQTILIDMLRLMTERWTTSPMRDVGKIAKIETDGSVRHCPQEKITHSLPSGNYLVSRHIDNQKTAVPLRPLFHASSSSSLSGSASLACRPHREPFGKADRMIRTTHIFHTVVQPNPSHSCEEIRTGWSFGRPYVGWVSYVDKQSSVRYATDRKLFCW